MTHVIQQLRDTYQSNHSRWVSPSAHADLQSQWLYYGANYPFLKLLPKSSRILEIGPGSGSFIAWLVHEGFTDVLGIEVAPEEAILTAERGLPIINGDALEYLPTKRNGCYDVIVLKAVLEHMPKKQGTQLMGEVSRVLSRSGLVVIDVPNMDWFLCGHERYMDLTHETGFTRESLSQLLRLHFSDVTIVGSREAITSGRSWVRVRILKPLLVACARFMALIMGEGASNVLFESRSIVAVARQPRSTS